ncbi:MAG TPA: PfkB family carbohydrate kinase, partial [Candidatus Kapabacteria bacterium]
KCPRLQYAVLTRAERGATLYDWNQKLVHHAEVPNVKVVDTTGSGDVFGSAFLFAILAGLMPERSLERAVQWASWNATLTSIEEILTSENE